LSHSPGLLADVLKGSDDLVVLTVFQIVTKDEINKEEGRIL
jgi:hypothetical protein